MLYDGGVCGGDLFPEISAFETYQSVLKSVAVYGRDVFPDERNKLVKAHHGTADNEVKPVAALADVAVLECHISEAE